MLHHNIEREAAQILDDSNKEVEEQYRMTRLDVLEDLLIQYEEDREVKKLRNLRQYFILLGIFKVVTDKELIHISVSSGKKYDFIMDGKKYQSVALDED